MYSTCILHAVRIIIVILTHILQRFFRSFWSNIHNRCDTKQSSDQTYILCLFHPTPLTGRTAVHWAAMTEHVEALKLLIRQGPDTIKDAQDSKVCLGTWQQMAQHATQDASSLSPSTWLATPFYCLWARFNILWHFPYSALGQLCNVGIVGLARVLFWKHVVGTK